MAEYGCQTSGMSRESIWPVARRFPAQNVKCNHNTQPLSRKMSRKNKTSIEENKSREKESSKFLERKAL